WTAAEVAERSGSTPDQTKRIWRALGFPEPADDEVHFTDGDVAALGTLSGIVSRGLLSMETALNLTRGVGQTMARLADWEVATLTPRLEENTPAIELPEGSEGEDSRLTRASLLAEAVAEDFEQ